MAKRKVKMIQGLSSPDFVYNPGDEVTVDDKFAEQLVDNEIAEYITSKKKDSDDE